MSFTYDGATLAALAEIPTFNDLPFDSGSNPGGFDNGGYETNFFAALNDLIDIANGIATAADYAKTQADASAASAVDALSAVGTLTGTSTSTNSLAGAVGGTKTWTTQASKSFEVGRTLRVSSDANPTTHWFDILVTSYSSTTLTGLVLGFAGSGSRADWTIRVTGDPAKSAGGHFTYLWLTDVTSSNPGAGGLKVNNATLSSLTAFYVSQTEFFGANIAAVLATMDDSTSTIKGRVIIRQISAPENMVVFDLTSTTLTDNGGWDTFAASYVSSNGTLANTALVSAIFLPQANKGDTGSTGSQGIQGNPGTAGADGADAGFKFTLNTATSGDPGTGKFRFDNATFLSATKVALNETDANALGLASVFAALDNSSSSNKALVIMKKAGSSAFYSFMITGVLTDQGTYDEYPITPIATSGSISNNDNFYFVGTIVGDLGTQGIQGVTGAQGAAASLTWLYTTGFSSPDQDPGSNSFFFDSTTISAATKLFIDNLGPGAVDVTAWLDSWDDSNNTTNRGTLIFTQANDSTKWAIFTENGTVINSTGYRTVPLVYVAGPGGFTNGATVVVTFERSGNKGSDGAGSGTITDTGSFNAGHLAIWGSDNQHIADGGVAGALANLNTVGSSQIDANAVTLAKLATQAAGTVLANNTGGAAVPTAITYATLKSAMSFTSTDVGLANVDNTSDANKPVSTAQQTEINRVRDRFMVRAATTANITISTALNNGDSLDSLTLATGDLVLVKDQTSTSENGIYVVSASPARDVQYDSYNEHPGARIMVQEGTTNADTEWACTSNRGGTIDSSAIVFTQWAGPSTATGRGLLAAADAATAFGLIKQSGTSGATGALQLATVAEAGTGTDTAKAVTAAGLFPAAVDVASSSTTSIGAAASSKVRITGTTGITAFDTIAAGIFREGYFQGALTITHNGTSLILPGAANITTAANDRFRALSLGSGNWIVLDFTPASGKAVIPPSATELVAGSLPDARLSSAATAYGRQSIWVPATAMTPNTTNGPASGTVQTTTNLVMLSTLDYDTTTQESAQFNIRMPDQWDESTTVFFRYVWKHAATSTNFGVVFALSALAMGDNEASDVTWSTEVQIADTGGTTNNIYHSAVSASGVAVKGIPSPDTVGSGDWVAFRVRRVPADGSDTMAIDAGLLGIELYITTNAAHDTAN